jgi:hypothetical protein
LSRAYAAALRRKPVVVSVFAGPMYYVHATRPCDFLQQQTTAVKVRPSNAIFYSRMGHSRMIHTICSMICLYNDF